MVLGQGQSVEGLLLRSPLRSCGKIYRRSIIIIGLKEDRDLSQVFAHCSTSIRTIFVVAAKSILTSETFDEYV